MNDLHFAFISFSLLAAELACPVAKASPINDYAVVTDGDTLLVGQDGISIRLAGIDAPELGQKCRRPDSIEWPCGLHAKHMLTEMVGTAPVSCGQLYFDDYDRVFATCVAPNGNDLGAAMVASGYALSVGRDQRYVAEQAAARLASKGIWSGSFQTPWEWRAQQREPEDE